MKPTILDLGELKIGELVRATFKEIVKSNSLSNEQILLLQSEKYCKETFDLNYPMILKVAHGIEPTKQRSVNGYPRYWSKPIWIKGEKFYVCNDWYDRNRTKYMTWSNQYS